jgi:iron complex outermembrane receptor protein
VPAARRRYSIDKQRNFNIDEPEGISVRTFSHPIVLCATSALVSIAAMPAFAQQPVTSRPGADQTLLSDVVVTATRQSDTVARVPLSISAVTQKSLDQQGIKNTADLQRIVPALTVSSQLGGATNLSIRGIVATTGAPTTGVYINDTPLQKRFVTASGITGRNGSPTPPLFDLERVEVLRGPQGTLYGGSSEGGTLRFITPEPSLTRYSGYVRTELSHVDHGGASYEGGVAVGGPFVQDKLGFRASIYGRKTAGYIDMVNPFANGAVRYKDANSRDATSGRLAVKFAPTDRSSITLSHYSARQTDNGGPDYYNAAYGGNNSTFTTTAQCFDTTRSIVTGASPLTAVTCPATAVPLKTVNGIYQRPSVTYGPFPYLNDKYTAITQLGGGLGVLNPTVSTLNLTDATIDYDFGPATLKSISSYYTDKTKGFQSNASVSAGGTVQRLVGFAPGAAATAGATGFPLNSLFPFDANGQLEPIEGFASVNTRHGISQEFRLASAANAKPLSWVAGVFFAHSNNRSIIVADANLAYANRLLYGIAENQRYVQVNADGSKTPIPAIQGVVFARQQELSDTEKALFGEANYWITPQIKATAGVRVSRNEFNYQALIYGPIAGFIVPTLANGGIGQGSQLASPVTPKFGLQYQINDSNMVYVTASKGFRPGGVNSPIPDGVCGPGLATLGLTVKDVPQTFDPDTVWAYEGGAKVRFLDNRVQVNASAFRIDWDSVQLGVSIPGCGPTYTKNAGTARSQGFDLQGQARVTHALVADFSLGYTDAKYTQTALGPAPLNGSAASPIALAGQHLPVPVWQGTVGAQYNFEYGHVPFYGRFDYQFSSAYDQTAPAGLPTYNPDTFRAPSTHQLNVRLGGTFAGWDANFFVNNLLNSRDLVSTGGGRQTCADKPACTSYSVLNPLLELTTIRPREGGVQVSRRF